MARTYITDDEFDEMVKMSKFYTKLQEDSIEKGKVLMAAEIIRSGIASLEELSETLHLTPAEITAIQAMLQRSSNGNGSIGGHE
jgi:hypothetical protein